MEKYDCDFCGKKNFKNQQALLGHYGHCEAKKAAKQQQAIQQPSTGLTFIPATVVPAQPAMVQAVPPISAQPATVVIAQQPAMQPTTIMDIEKVRLVETFRKANVAIADREALAELILSGNKDDSNFVEGVLQIFNINPRNRQIIHLLLYGVPTATTYQSYQQQLSMPIQPQQIIAQDPEIRELEETLSRFDKEERKELLKLQIKEKMQELRNRLKGNNSPVAQAPAPPLTRQYKFNPDGSLKVDANGNPEFMLTPIVQNSPTSEIMPLVTAMMSQKKEDPAYIKILEKQIDYERTRQQTETTRAEDERRRREDEKKDHEKEIDKEREKRHETELLRVTDEMKRLEEGQKTSQKDVDLRKLELDYQKLIHDSDRDDRKEEAKSKHYERIFEEIGKYADKIPGYIQAFKTGQPTPPPQQQIQLFPEEIEKYKNEIEAANGLTEEIWKKIQEEREMKKRQLQPSVSP